MAAMSAQPTPPFVHLRVHSEFSVSDGIVRIPDLIKKVVALEQPAVALTDLSNLFGLIKFYKAARAKGIKAIAGCDVWVSTLADRDKRTGCCCWCGTGPATTTCASC